MHVNDRPRWRCAVLLLAAAAACGGNASSSTSGTQPVAAADPAQGWPGCSGSFDTRGSPSGAYFVTDFGCSSLPEFTDSGDNCCGDGTAWAASHGLCPAGANTSACTCTDDPSCGSAAAQSCERAVNWFSTGGNAFGLGARLCLQRPDGTHAVVVLVFDNGPACFREVQFGGYALDISYPAILRLYGEEEGVADRKIILANEVDSSIPLGPVDSCNFSSADAGVSDAGTTEDAGVDAGNAIDAGNAVDAGNSEDAGPSDAGAVDAGNADAGPQCMNDGDCNPGNDGSGQICSAGACVAGCNADWECPGVTSCMDGMCK